MSVAVRHCVCYLWLTHLHPFPQAQEALEHKRAAAVASAREAKETARALAAAAAISRQKGDKAAREDVQGDGKAKQEQKKQKKKKLTPMEKLKLRMQQKFNNTVSKAHVWRQGGM